MKRSRSKFWKGADDLKIDSDLNRPEQTANASKFVDDSNGSIAESRWNEILLKAWERETVTNANKP